MSVSIDYAVSRSLKLVQHWAEQNLFRRRSPEAQAGPYAPPTFVSETPIGPASGAGYLPLILGAGGVLLVLALVSR